MAKIATYSTGYTDTYKGTRAVTAGWMLTLPCGRVISGHSMTRALAESSARSAASERCPHREMTMSGGGNRNRYSYTPAALQHFLPLAKKAGFDSIKAYNAAMKAKRAPWLATCKIEVVDL